MGMTVLELADKLRTEADAYEFLEGLRWNGQPACAHCGAADPYFLTPKNGKTRRTRTKIPVRTWVMVIFEMASSRTGSPPERSSGSTG